MPAGTVGDYIDDLGPASEASATAAEEIGRIEAQIRHFVDEGMTQAEARGKLGYTRFRPSAERPVGH